MDSNGIMWAGIASIIGLLSLAAVIAERRILARMSMKGRLAESAKEAPARRSPLAEQVGASPVQGERYRLMEAKNSAETAYAQRVSAAEREFCARKNRADVLLRAAEMILEHAQEYGRGQLGSIRDRDGIVEACEQEIDFDGEIFAIAPSAFNHPAPLVESLEKRRSQRISSAREHLVEALFEHRSAVAAAEKQLADAKAQSDDVLSATAALEALDARDGKR
ncbi:hypothetical protein SPF06_18460 [Sinomonas sp. JGH33]|uniref:Uncharacterized protein n=1 Tax=Sinomonas terricola TaxID=3110330 RepID=A0ABU5TB22_9MICC|nr:hypothetical protein [Sinomonas sp. JGH33]MEA5456710.1 hypothetical protein [Sinomonas sp. JGH33]